MKFTQHGQIKVRLRRAEGDRLLMEIEDSGIGIPPDAIERIFEPFSQTDDSTTRQFGGTGLGLAIARQIVRLMGGELSVESTVGRGSTFRAEWPAPAAESTEIVKLAPAVSAAHTFDANVLLAEDNQVNQLIAETILTKLGCKTRVVANGTSALALFKEGDFDIVLMDCHMPEMDGYQATAAIRALEAQEGSVRMPIIAVTANVMVGERERCIAAGMDDYVSKPFRLADIDAALEKWAGAKLRRV